MVLVSGYDLTQNRRICELITLNSTEFLRRRNEYERIQSVKNSLIFLCTLYAHEIQYNAT